MAIFYSASTGGFYMSGIHGVMPGDIVEITKNHYDSLLAGQSGDKMISHDDSGFPVLVDLPPISFEAVQANRQQAYQQISDPLFFKYQRGEATKQEWLDSVSAINEANPYPVKN